MAVANTTQQFAPASAETNAEPAPTWHLLSTYTTVEQLGSNLATGLSSHQAAELQKSVGPNELVERSGRGPWRLLWEQFTATMVLILIAAGIVSLFLQKWQEATAIFAIVILFGLLGFIQEYRAERAMAALKKLAVPVVRVRRDGQVKELSARDLVPGDVVLLEAGNLVPADIRLAEVANMRIQEAALTGESEAVEKDAQSLDKVNMPLGDRRNMAYMGTVVTYGRGAGVVVETGMRTELGKVATMLQKVENEPTPLQKRLDRLGKALAWAGVGHRRRGAATGRHVCAVLANVSRNQAIGGARFAGVHCAEQCGVHLCGSREGCYPPRRTSRVSQDCVGVSFPALNQGECLIPLTLLDGKL